MNSKAATAAYQEWLRAAYLYYITPGEETGMCDAQWDARSKEFYAARDQHPAADYPVLHHPNFQGGSLFWLKREEYPREVTQPVGNPS